MATQNSSVIMFMPEQNDQKKKDNDIQVVK